MKMNESRRFFLFLLTLSLFLTPVYSTVPKSPATQSPMLPFTDIDQHWAKDTIIRASEKNIVIGYGDGTFRPDNPVSRTEFITLMSRSGAAHAGLKWPSGAAPDPNAFISRQDAATMLGGVLPDPSTPDAPLLDPFADKDQVKDWARDGMIILLQMGYLKGYEDGRLEPGGLLTRAQAITLLDRIASEAIQDDASQVSIEEVRHRSTNSTHSLPPAPPSQGENQSDNETTTAGAFILNYNHLYRVTMDGDGTVTEFATVSAIDSSIQPTDPTPSSFLVTSFPIPAGGISDDRLTFQNSNDQSFTVRADAQFIEIGLNSYNLVASYAAVTPSDLEAGDHIFLYDTTSINAQSGQANLVFFHRGLAEKYGVILEYQEQTGTGESALPARVRLKDASGKVRTFAFPLAADGENGLNATGIDLTDSTSLSANQLIQYSMNSSAELSWVTKGAVADPLFYGSCTLLDSGVLKTDLQGTLPISVIPVVLVLEDQRLHLANLSEIEKGVTLNYGMTAFITIGNTIQAMLIDATAVQSMPGSDGTIAPSGYDVYHPAVEPEALPDVYQQVQDLEALQTASPIAVVIASATYAGLDWPSGTGLIQMGAYYVTEDVSVYEAYTDGWGQVDYSPIGLFNLQPGMTIILYNTSYMTTPEAPRNAFDLIIVTP